jgi:hypothetical protein
MVGFGEHSNKSGLHGRSENSWLADWLLGLQRRALLLFANWLTS